MLLINQSRLDNRAADWERTWPLPSPVSVFLKIHGARCGVEKGTQMGGPLGGEG
jgi:hypothetical protein